MLFIDCLWTFQLFGTFRGEQIGLKRFLKPIFHVLSTT